MSLAIRVLCACLAFSVGLNLVLLFRTNDVIDLKNNNQVWMRPKPSDRMKGRQPLAFLLEFDEEKLDLTQEQSVRFCEIQEKWLETASVLRRESAASYRDLFALIIKEVTGVWVVSEDSLNANRNFDELVVETRKEPEELMVTLIAALKQQRALLNESQTQKFDMMLQKRFAHFNEMISRRIDPLVPPPGFPGEIMHPPGQQRNRERHAAPPQEGATGMEQPPPWQHDNIPPNNDQYRMNRHHPNQPMN